VNRISESESVKCIYIGNKYNTSPWIYVSQDINTDYPKHSTGNFLVTIRRYTYKKF